MGSIHQVLLSLQERRVVSIKASLTSSLLIYLMTIAIKSLLRRSEIIFKHVLVVELCLNSLHRENMNLNANVGLYLSILS